MPQELRLGTRGSPLALWQANAVARRIAEAGGPPCRIVIIKTSGDRDQGQRLSAAGGKGLFVKEIEDALLAGGIDLAVHSSKDMPALLPHGLTIGGTLPREDPRDAVVLPFSAGPPTVEIQAGTEPSGRAVEALVSVLGSSPNIGTSSVRRVAQLGAVLPRARFADMRGNLGTRLRKLDAGDVDALVLAAAGLHRLGLASRISMALPVDLCLPAPGQGIVAVEIREDDRETRRSVERANDPMAAAALEAERALVAALGGGCQTPIGALALPLDGGQLEMVATVVSQDGKRAVRRRTTGPLQEAMAVGSRLGAQLLADGAKDILAEDAMRPH
jgi:hydroxymethylbilane synthase